ncbi:MAG: LacI family transcriptional regulator [Candidatus Dormibacteraeota bacterium]|nr:LacI family transcriptional regulator [Candidatus Dormibacteraeota bacterium]
MSSPPVRARHPTISDVAAAAVVSKSTVSNVIRGVPTVRPGTRERVLRCIDELGYEPNAHAQQLVLQRPTVFGVVVGDLANPFYAEMAKQIERAAAARGYQAMFCNTQGDEDTELKAIQSFLQYRVAGILFLAYAGDAERARRASEGRVPAAFVTCTAGWGDVVGGDDRDGAAKVTQHLLDLGHRRIAYFTDPIVEDAADRDRQEGYRSVLERAGLEPASFHWERPAQKPARPDRNEAQMDAVLRDGFTAVFSSNDLGAIELLECADRLGIRVPEKLSVAGFDDVLMAGMARINLTTVRQPQEELARLAVETLAARACGELIGGSLRRTVELELVIRGSTAAPGAGGSV